MASSPGSYRGGGEVLLLPRRLLVAVRWSWRSQQGAVSDGWQVAISSWHMTWLWEVVFDMRRTLTWALAAALFFLAWGLFQYHHIVQVGEMSAPEPADVIVLLGAAVWPSGPSPALQARIYHAAELYHGGYSGSLILTGGLGQHPPAEAAAMRDALVELGVPGAALHLEDQATSTVENLKYSRQIMDREGWESAIIVTDAFHVRRALLVATDLGIAASGAPAKNSVLYRNPGLRFRYTVREVFASTGYYVNRMLRRW